MANYPYYPQNFQNYPQNFQQSYPQNYPQYPQTNTTPTQQIQNGGFISVRGELEARNYPVAPGNSITFKDENAPYVYTKTMGFSQLDRPTFDKYRLVKEEDTSVSALEPHTDTLNDKTDNLSPYALKSEIEPIMDEIEELKKEIESMREKKPSARSKKEDDKNEHE